MSTDFIYMLPLPRQSWPKDAEKFQFQNQNKKIIHPILIAFFIFMFILLGYWWFIEKYLLLYFKSALKRGQISKFRIFERYIKWLFCVPFLMCFCWWMDCVVCRCISCVFYGFWDKLKRMKIIFIFLPILMQ